MGATLVKEVALVEAMVLIGERQRAAFNKRRLEMVLQSAINEISIGWKLLGAVYKRMLVKPIVAINQKLASEACF